jgi:hypothetical protein
VECIRVTIIRFLPGDVSQRLAELNRDLTPQVLEEALRRGEIGRNACSPLDPGPLFGMTPWGRTIRGLRELLSPMGWRRKERPQSLTISPDVRVAIAVATGTIATGNKDAVPTTKWPKGAATAQAIQQNAQLVLPGMAPKEEEERFTTQAYTTWVLLFRRVTVLAETGEPVDVGDPTDAPAAVDVEIDDEFSDLEIDAGDQEDSAIDSHDDLAAGGLDGKEVDDARYQTVILCEFALPEKYTFVKSATGKKTVRITEWRERLILDKIDVSGLELPSVDRKENDTEREMEIEVVRRK